MKNQKMKAILLKVEKFFNKKVSALLPLSVGLISGIIKYIVCQTFQCALGYFIGGSLITAIIISVLNAILKIACDKIRKENSAKDITLETEATENTFENEKLNDKEEEK